jgi:DNA-binding beta-propeller fold protein YncE
MKILKSSVQISKHLFSGFKNNFIMRIPYSLAKILIIFFLSSVSIKAGELTFNLKKTTDNLILSFNKPQTGRIEINFIRKEKPLTDASITVWPVATDTIILTTESDLSDVTNAEITLIKHEYTPNKSINRFGTGPGKFREATTVYADPWNNIFVVDAISDQIVQFSHGLDFVRTFGSFSIQPAAAQKGDIYRLENSNFDSPFAIVAGSNLNYFVSDSRNNRVVELDANGNFLQEIRPPDGFDEPSMVRLTSRNEIVVLDPEKDRIVFFNSLGFHLFNLGGYGKSPDRLNHPLDFAIGEDDNIYVLDRGNGLLKKFARSSRFINSIRLKPFPRAIAIDPFGLITLIQNKGVINLTPDLIKIDPVFPGLKERVRNICFSPRKQAFTVSAKNSTITEWLPRTRVEKQLVNISD